MRVLVASTVVPFVKGGGTIIVDSLERALAERGHEVDVLRLPFESDVNTMLPQMLAMRLHHLEDASDRLICIRTPSYLIQHPEKVVWFIHHHRGAYDLWDTEYADLHDDPRGRSLRDAIQAADDTAFEEARAIFANSHVVRNRLLKYNGRSVEVLYPPLDYPEQFSCSGYGDAIVYISRIHHHKRQWLAVQAMRYTTTPVRLVLAGASGSAMDEAYIVDLIRDDGLESKVSFRKGWLDEAEKAQLLAESLAAVYCPFDEDSYGYTSLEAHQSVKAVVTTTDSGGVLELVEDRVNGFVCEPTPQALAARFDQLYEDRALAERMGNAGRERMIQLDISWDRVVNRLLA